MWRGAGEHVGEFPWWLEWCSRSGQALGNHRALFGTVLQPTLQIRLGNLG